MTSEIKTRARTDPHKVETRRDFLTKATYATPVLLSLPALPSFAQSGSGGGGNGGGGDIDPTDCIAQYDQFLMDRGFPGFFDFFEQVQAQPDGPTPEQQAVIDEFFLIAFPDDGSLCGLS